MKKDSNKKKTVLLTATGGGHLEQLKQLDLLKQWYDLVYVVAKSKVNRTMKGVLFVSDFRNHRKIMKYFDMVRIFAKSFFILLRKKPDVVISTGAASTYGLCWLQKKVFRKKVIFIESFADRYQGTVTGDKVYRFADHFVVQWEELLNTYPDAVYGGMIY